MDTTLQPDAVRQLDAEMRELFLALTHIQAQIHQRLLAWGDGKTLKGNELVGWLGEIYARLLLDGRLVADRFEHDVETADGRRISVKTRKGSGSGWRMTSAIPKIDGDDCPTHLLFVHLNDDYSLDRMWLFAWQALHAQGRFKMHRVRGNLRSFVFLLNETRDAACVVYDAHAAASTGRTASV